MNKLVGVLLGRKPRRQFFLRQGPYRPAQRILVFIVNEEKSPLDAHADVSSRARGLNFNLSSS